MDTKKQNPITEYTFRIIIHVQNIGSRERFPTKKLKFSTHSYDQKHNSALSPPLLEIVLQFTIDKGKNIIKFEQSVSSMAYAIKINKRERKKIERRIKGRSNIKEVDELTYQDDEQVSSFDSKKKTFRLYGHSPTYNLLQSECQWITLTEIYLKKKKIENLYD